MNAKINYKILPESKLIIECFDGNITFNDIIGSKRKKNLASDFNPSFNHIIDLRKAHFEVNYNDIDKIVQFQQDNKEFIKRRKSAFLTDSPQQASLSILFSMSMKNLPIEFELFSTVRATLNWLELWDFSESAYDEIIESF